MNKKMKKACKISQQKWLNSVNMDKSSVLKTNTQNRLKLKYGLIMFLLFSIIVSSTVIASGTKDYIKISVTEDYIDVISMTGKTTSDLNFKCLYIPNGFTFTGMSKHNTKNYRFKNKFIKVSLRDNKGLYSFDVQQYQQKEKLKNTYLFYDKTNKNFLYISADKKTILIIETNISEKELNKIIKNIK